MPFGAGARICIGNHFAMMEGHLLLATLAQRVTFELVPGQHIEPDPTKTITVNGPESPCLLSRGIGIKLRIAELCNGERKSAFFS